MTTVRVNTKTYATTHVATGILRSLKQLIVGCGLDPTRIAADWAVLEAGTSTWLETRHLDALVLEVYDPRNSTVLVGRFDFTIDYGYYVDGDGSLWIDPDTVAFVIRKNGSYPSRCRYRIVADLLPGAPSVVGWSSTTLRSTAGWSQVSAGTGIGGGSLGADLGYWRKP